VNAHLAKRNPNEQALRPFAYRRAARSMLSIARMSESSSSVIGAFSLDAYRRMGRNALNVESVGHASPSLVCDTAYGGRSVELHRPRRALSWSVHQRARRLPCGDGVPLATTLCACHPRRTEGTCAPIALGSFSTSV
jgi:hypothetical protein